MTATATAHSKDALVGTWKLTSDTYTDDKGEARNLNAAGFLTYTADDRFSVMIA